MGGRAVWDVDDLAILMRPVGEMRCLQRHFGVDCPTAAVRDVDAIYTDVWTSMGQEMEYAERKKTLKRYQVTESMMALANSGALFMHCLPAHRGEEVSDEVIESPISVVFDQAEHRRHARRLSWSRC